MSAPARIAEPARTAPTRRRATASERGRSAAVQRAYARRAQRTQRLLGGAPDAARAGGRARFVVVVMALLGTALVTTLWLSTAAAADSYRLGDAQTQARDLSERTEQLSRRVATLETAPELARRARDLGMVPAGDPARLVVLPDGVVIVVGDPEPVVAPAPRPAEVADPSPAAPAPARGA
ncbi:MAG: septum formation initiator [Pseudonocardiaceae bacterium]